MRSRRGTQYDQGPRAVVGRTAPAYFEGFGKHVFLKPPERRKFMELLISYEVH